MATGQSLEELRADLMIRVAYVSMLDTLLTNTEEVAKARERFAKMFRDAEFQYDTGLPPIAMSVPPADAGRQ